MTGSEEYLVAIVFPLSRKGTGDGDWFRDMPRQFEQMRREMEGIFQEQFTDIDETKVPKDLHDHV